MSVSFAAKETGDGGVSDSFAERAENYYKKRPELLSLLQDLYNKYVLLSDRYVQSQTKLSPPSHCRSQSQVSFVHSDISDVDHYSSDAESSLSYQLPVPAVCHDFQSGFVADEVVVELVMRLVETDFLQHEMGILEKYQSDSTRKMDLQRSLLDVLESERVVLLTENARLGFKAKAIAEENEELASEVGFMRRKAGELAQCVVKLREDHRVCMLGRKIESLQAKIYGLEKRNRECYEVMARREEEKAEILRGVCLELERVKMENKTLKETAAALAARKKNKWGWWMRKVEAWVPSPCGSHVQKH